MSPSRPASRRRVREARDRAIRGRHHPVGRHLGPALPTAVETIARATTRPATSLPDVLDLEDPELVIPAIGEGWLAA